MLTVSDLMTILKNEEDIVRVSLEDDLVVLSSTLVCKIEWISLVDPALIRVVWGYQAPCRSYSQAIHLQIDNLGAPAGSESFETNLKYVLDYWQKFFPAWTNKQGKLAVYIQGEDQFTPCSFREPRVLQNLCRMQIAVAAKITSGHQNQAELSEIFYQIGRFIDDKNREIEKALSLALRTP